MLYRNWYSQDCTIVECFKSNYSLAEQCWNCVQEENIDGIGDCLSKYWSIKKALAPGCEPQLVKNILEVLKPYIVGGSLAGAGGGGFLAAILKDGVNRKEAIEVARRLPGTERMTFHEASVDVKGLNVQVNGKDINVPFL